MLFALMLMTVSVAVGCSGGRENPIEPLTENPALTNSPANSGQVQAHLWGYYDVTIDVENETVEVVANRDGMFHVNVVNFFNMKPANLGSTINYKVITADYVDVDLKMGIKHPFPGQSMYHGYDVRGIFIGDGHGTMEYNSDLKYAVAGTDQYLRDYNEGSPPDAEFCGNADGYTRWWNPSEFQTGMNLLGYTDGLMATGDYLGTATLNPYKYFADGLGACDSLMEFLLNTSDRGVFSVEASCERNYYIRFPIPAPNIKFNYAILAHWENPGNPQTPPPNNAPEAVAVHVDVTDDLWYVNDSNKGGNLLFDIGVFNWDSTVNAAGVMEDYTIYIESPDVLSEIYHANTADMTPVGSGMNYHKYHFDIPADNLSFNSNDTGEYAEYWVIVECANEDYTNDFGVTNLAGTDPLAAFFRFENLYIHDDQVLFDPVLFEWDCENFTGGETSLFADYFTYTTGDWMWCDPSLHAGPNCGEYGDNADDYCGTYSFVVLKPLPVPYTKILVDIRYYGRCEGMDHMYFGYFTDGTEFHCVDEGEPYGESWYLGNYYYDLMTYDLTGKLPGESNARIGWRMESDDEHYPDFGLNIRYLKVYLQ